jgi:prepilin-type N-terminal cleavage/methylation domain-containing protein
MKLNQKTDKVKLNRGFTVVELLVVIVILAIISTVSWVALANYRENQTLLSTTEVIVSSLSEARSQSVSAVNDEVHGVHFTSNSLTLFEGSQYSPSNPKNSVTVFNSSVSVSTSGLTSSSSDIVFEKITGRGSASGQIVVFSVASSTKNFVIVVEPIGISYRK